MDERERAGSEGKESPEYKDRWLHMECSIPNAVSEHGPGASSCGSEEDVAIDKDDGVAPFLV